MGKEIWGMRFDSDVIDILRKRAAIHKQLSDQGDWLDKTSTVQDLIREYAELQKTVNSQSQSQAPKQEANSNIVHCPFSEVPLDKETCDICKQNPKVYTNCPFKKHRYT